MTEAKSLRNVLNRTAEFFPVDKFSYVLHVKSHGSDKLALNTMLSRRHEDISKEQLIASMKQLDGLLPTSVTSYPAGPETNVGTSKELFFSTISEAAKANNMNIVLLFLESCRSGTGLADSVAVEDIGILISSDHKGVEYQNFDFAKLYQTDTSPGREYLNQLKSLSAKQHQEKYRTIDIPTHKNFSNGWLAVGLSFGLLLVLGWTGHGHFAVSGTGRASAGKAGAFPDSVI